MTLNARDFLERSFDTILSMGTKKKTRAMKNVMDKEIALYMNWNNCDERRFHRSNTCDILGEEITGLR